MSDSPSNMENPYAPPEDSVAAQPAANQLESACRCFRGMAWAGTIYPASTAARMILELMANEYRRRNHDPELLIVQSVIMGLVAVYVVWISNRLRRDFDKTYKLARWTAVIGSALFFPILTIPAVMAVSRMTKYRKSQSA